VLCRYGQTAVLSIAYRVAPEHPFPAAVDDALASWRWARANAASLGIDVSRMSIGGDSAGGNLAAVVSLLTARTDEAPANQLLIYPAVDPVTARQSRQLFREGLFLTMRDVEAFELAYRGGQQGEATDPRVAPIRAAGVHGIPPALVITAGFDVLRDEGEAYAAALEAAGNTVRLHRFPSLTHGFIHMTDVSPAARDALREVATGFRALADAASATDGSRQAVKP
jgi:acetyl esterase